MKNNILLFLTLVFLESTAAQQKLKLPALVSDNMVIQQSTQINIWGWAEKNKLVEIIPSWTKTRSQSIQMSWKMENHY